MQEDLTVKDTEEILEDLKNDRVPKAGPRYDVRLSYTSLCLQILTEMFLMWNIYLISFQIMQSAYMLKFY
jgi:hypothetical protein